MERFTAACAYTAAGITAFLGSVTLQDWALIAGIVASLGTFLVNWWYKRLEVKRKDSDEYKH